MKRYILIPMLLLAWLCTLVLPGCSQQEATLPSGSTTALNGPATTAPTTTTAPTVPEELETVYLVTGAVYETAGEACTVRYDEAGKLLEVLQEKAGGETEILVSCSYDDDGNLLSYSNTILGLQQTFDPQGNILTEQRKTGTTNYTYDPAGRCIQEERLRADGTPISLTRYSYDAQGNLLSEVLERDGSVYSEILHTYDEQNRHLTQTYYRNGVVSPEGVSYTWQYDAQGNLVQEQCYYGEMLGTRMEYTYDAAGNKLSVCQYNSDGSAFQNFYTYDEAGNIIHWKDVTVDAMGKQYIRNFYYEYDAQGHMLLQHDIDQHGKERYFRWSYDEMGNQLSYAFTSPSKSYQYQWTYDEKGNKLTETKTGDSPYETVWTYDGEGRVTSAVTTGSNNWSEDYEYDAQGNLLRHSQSVDSVTYVTAYTYTAYTVTAEETRQLLAIQEQVFEYLQGNVITLD